MNNAPENPHADGESIDYIKQYVDASAESADRVRFVLLIMVTASILALVATWNSRTNGWPTSRLIVATNAQKFYDEKGQRITGSDEQVKQQVWPKFFNEEKYERASSQAERDRYKRDREQAYDRAKAFVEASRFADFNHLQEHVHYLERARIEKVLYITVPFFGVVFDINDLGIFAGITFIIALLLFRFSLLRELRNLRLVFLQAKTPEHLRVCYDMLSMQQVLTTPPELEPVPSERRRGGRWREVFWNTVSKGLYLIPFVVQFEIFREVRNTYQNVEKIFPGTVRGIYMTATLLFFNALLTGLCLYLGWKVDKRWRNHARWILANTAPRMDQADTDDVTREPTPAADSGANVSDAPNDTNGGQNGSGVRRATSDSKRAYFTALLFACVFVASVVFLLGSVGGVFRSTSETPIWPVVVAIVATISSAVGTISNTVLGWRKDRREMQEQELKIKQLEQELAEREKPAPPVARDNPQAKSS